MDLFGAISEWLRKPSDLSPAARRIIAENPEQFNRLYQQATGTAYAPPPKSTLRLGEQSPLINLQNNADQLKNQPFQIKL